MTNNLFLKISAVVVAVILWASVQAASDKVVERTYDIPITYTNAVYLDESDLYLKESPKTISIKVKAHTSAFQFISAARFNATADLSARIGDDPYKKLVQVKVTPDQSIKESLMDFSYKNSDWVNITLEPIQTKEFTVEVVTTGELPKGYRLSGDGFQVEPETITLRAPESRFSTINRVVVNVPLDSVEEEVLEQQLQPVLLDANDKIVSMGDGMSFNTDTITVRTELLKASDVSVVVEGPSGTPAEGYYCSEVKVEPSNITIVGMRADLANVTRVTIPKEDLNIEGATENKEIVVDITKYLPDNITLYGDSDTVKVVFVIEQLEERSYRIPVSQISLIGEEADKKYTFLGDTVVVTLMGLEEDLDSLKSEEIELAVDVTGLHLGMNAGISINVQVRSGFLVKKTPVVSVMVREAEVPSSEPPDSSETSETESTSFPETGTEPESESTEESEGETFPSDSSDEMP